MADAPPVAPDTKICPYCAEVIKAAAVKCRFCGSALDPNAVHEQAVPPPKGSAAAGQPAVPAGASGGQDAPDGAGVTAPTRRWLRWAISAVVIAAAAVAIVVVLLRHGKGKKETRYEAPACLDAISRLVEDWYERAANASPSLVVFDGPQPVPQFPSNPRVSRPCEAPDCNSECVPPSISMVAGGRAYEVAPEAWAGLAQDDSSLPAADPTIWELLHFPRAKTELPRGGTIHFQYCYSSTASGEFSVHAFGDLDGDGVPSEFRRQGRVVADGSVVIGPLETINEGE